jgi:hypothetical protein
MPGNSMVLVEQEFENDTRMIGEQTDRFLQLVYPGYLVDKNGSLDEYFERDSSLLLDSMTFFRISRCTVENAEDLFESVNAKIEKLFTALHSIGVSVGYGIVSRSGVTNLVLCVYSSEDVPVVESIVSGMLSGIELEDYSPKFQESGKKAQNYGVLSGVPTLFLKEQKQTFSLSAVMRTLNGSDYTLLFLAKPVGGEIVNRQIGALIDIKDKAFAVSKRNVSRNASITDTDTHIVNVNDGTTKNSIAQSVGGSAGGLVGGLIGSLVPGIGTIIGGAFGAGLGTIIGAIASGGKGSSHSEGYSDAISKAITAGETVAGDIQNGFAIELMNYADKAIERLKGSQSNGIWQTAICYSADSDLSRNIIKACLCGELSKPDPDKLPLLAFEPHSNPVEQQILLIPSFLHDGNDVQNPLCTYINSSELGLLCTVPTDSVPDFELRTAKSFPMIKSVDSGSVVIGNVTDGKRKLANMPFGLSTADLNKHTFVCGITGSGKTSTVKKMLAEAKKPFMVIESAKKEYRNIPLETSVYTLGKPEINCPRINPFYVMPGVNPQSHIDYLKDLFIASFSFYGPMPYILEKCLHNVYKNKGWNLTLGFHPLLANTQSSVDFFDIGYIQKQYTKESSRYLFPTMRKLKDEIERYVNEEMDYEGEVAGNIKTAIKVRLENLCVGAKGYMFNTYEHLKMSELLEKNTVFELEGLVDDSDKAFCVGLMVIFINEYRQTVKETRGNQKLELQHLLVIEEAHRLLKNIDTERSSENTGNPKGKAVEHFTNMIAEMRSYGQGVIVAEQIPTKLAPDVIKNSSNKIIQRIVSVDDQQIIANTIGISANDAIQLGTLETGYALCHKEGMSLPVSVKIDSIEDDFVSDELLYNKGDVRERVSQISISAVREVLYEGDVAKTIVLALLNTVLTEQSELTVNSREMAGKRLVALLNQRSVSRSFMGNLDDNVAVVIADMTLNFLIRGVYAAEKLPDNEFLTCLLEFLLNPITSKAQTIKKKLAALYGQDTEEFAKRTIAELIKRKTTVNTNIRASIKEYFIDVSENTITEISQSIN